MCPEDNLIIYCEHFICLRSFPSLGSAVLVSCGMRRARPRGREGQRRARPGMGAGRWSPRCAVLGVGKLA